MHSAYTYSGFVDLIARPAPGGPDEEPGIPPAADAPEAQTPPPDPMAAEKAET